ncbi:transposable element Tcb1 transposase [Trichonephila clavipes]|uniref:Transposable element Tcb1 transposase n=1 Tax=Trichonephila clavipes TaxID=2585209 RepID=A0A8X6RBX1_TRICX|nr:transposable element Tcb1 transposase [Trichonephila clavipes]
MGFLMAVRYRDEVIENIVRFYAAAVVPTFVLMDDNARPHRANIVDDYLESEGIARMALSAYSPDLNPIENLWNALGRAVSSRFSLPATLIELETALQEERRLLNSAVVDHLIESMVRSCQVIYSQFGLAIHQNDHQASSKFVEWAQNEIAVVPDFHKRILFSDEAHFWLNGYVNKQNCRISSEANPQVYVETPLHSEKLTVWCALWAGGILLQKR